MEGNKSQSKTLVNKTLIGYIHDSALALREKDKIYSAVIANRSLVDTIKEYDSLIRKTSNPDIKKELEKIKESKLEGVSNEVLEGNKTLEYGLSLPVVMDSHGPLTYVLLPVLYEDRETGLAGKIVSEVSSVAAKPIIMNAQGVVALKTYKRNRNKIFVFV